MPNWNRQQLLKMRRNIHLAVVSLPDEEAVDTPELFPAWQVGVTYSVDARFQYDGRLYKVIQAHTSQEDWTPDTATSLYTEVEKPGDGESPESPIAYNNNMELFQGKYYSQDGVVYICTRSTGVPVYNPLVQLIGLYVEVV